MTKTVDEFGTATAEIRDLVTKMFVYTDRRRWDDLADVFADRVTLDWTALLCGEPATIAGAEVGSIWKGLMSGWRATQHLTGNLLVRIDGDEASVSVDAQATHYLPDDLGDSRWVLGCYYDMRARRSAIGWRLVEVTLHPLWSTGNRDLLRRAAESVS